MFRLSYVLLKVVIADSSEIEIKEPKEILKIKYLYFYGLLENFLYFYLLLWTSNYFYILTFTLRHLYGLLWAFMDLGGVVVQKIFSRPTRGT